jgi:hypothetical protein
MFFILPLSNMVFMTTSPPQEHKNFCVVTVVRAFLLTAIISSEKIGRVEYTGDGKKSQGGSASGHWMIVVD